MYCEHFGLNDYPFRRSGETLVPGVGSSFHGAYQQIEDGVQMGLAIQLVLGAPGTGKTRLLACLGAQLGERYRVVRPNFTRFSEEEFLWKLAQSLGDGSVLDDGGDMEARVQALLGRENGDPRGLLLLIDDAERLGRSTLARLPALFPAAEAGSAARAQVVLTACPELEDRLLDPELLPVWEAVSQTCRLEPLHSGEVGQYLAAAMAAAGHMGEPVFGDDAVDLIAARSAGVPRRINNLGGAALLAAYERGARRVTADMVDEAVATLVDTEERDMNGIAGPDDERPAAHGGPARAADPIQETAAAGQGVHHWAGALLRRLTSGMPGDPSAPQGWIGVVWRYRGTALAALVVAVVGVTAAAVLPSSPPQDTAAEVAAEPSPDPGAQIAALQRELQRAARERAALEAAIEALGDSLAQVQARLSAAAAPPSTAAAETASARGAGSFGGSEAQPPAAPTPQPSAGARVSGAPGPGAAGERAAAEASAELPEVPAQPDPAAAQARPDAGDASADRVLVVSRGDTLWSIARRQGLSVDALADLNGLDSTEPLQPGQRLRLPAGSGAAPPAQWYTVRRGDSLSGIGRRFGVSVERLTRWNDLQAPDALRPGQRLQVARAGEAVRSDGAAGRSP